MRRPIASASPGDGGPAASSTAGANDMRSHLTAYDNKTLLRLVMCGSVDDGKSTLMGRVLYESHALVADQLPSPEADCEAGGTRDEGLDFALVLAGLAADGAQGMTIEIDYRQWSTDRRHFIVADAPGHEQYTRQVISGASTADCAVILVDARKGILTQTRRHSLVVALLGIKDVALAVNKMDLVGYSERRFREIEEEYRNFARQIGLARTTCIPVSALTGDNVLAKSDRMAGYNGPTLMAYLETVEVDQAHMRDAPSRLPAQWVNRRDHDFCGYAGPIASGGSRPADQIVAAPSGRERRVERVVAYDGNGDVAVSHRSIPVTIDELDVTRGDVTAHSDQPLVVADEFEATIIWMAEEPMLRGRGYLLRLAGQAVTGTIARMKYKVSVDTLEHLAATRLETNEIGVCGVELGEAITFDPRENRETGGFVLVDRITNITVGVGLIHFVSRRAHNISWQSMTIDRRARAQSLHQRPLVLWLTGLPAAGKSTIANLVERELHRRGHHTYLLDGDNVRHGLNSDLGFTEADRVENIRRVAEVARLMFDAALIVLVSFISPFRAERQMARSLFEQGEFIEIFVDTPLGVAEKRDPKGLYRKARRGELKNFTGIDSPYEPPESPELRIDTTKLSARAAAQAITESLGRDGLL